MSDPSNRGDQFPASGESGLFLRIYAPLFERLRDRIIALKDAGRIGPAATTLPPKSSLEELLLPEVTVVTGTYEGAEASYAYVGINGHLKKSSGTIDNGCRVVYLLHYDPEGIITDDSKGIIIAGGLRNPAPSSGESNRGLRDAKEAAAWDSLEAELSPIDALDTSITLVRDDVQLLEDLLNSAFSPE